MQYNSETNGEDIVSEILDICGATTATYSVNSITRRFNRALDDYFDIAFESSGAWPFDDTNQTASSIAVQNLVSGTNAYKISAFTGSAVNIRGVSVLSDAAAVVIPKQEFFNEVDFEIDYSTTYTGTPAYYMLYNNFIYLRPTPNYSETSGLRIYSDRTPLYMTPSDTVKEPGVPKMHHLYLCRKTALPYLIDKRMPQTQSIAQLIQNDEMNIKRYYARRDKQGNGRIVPWFNSNKYADSNK